MLEGHNRTFMDVGNILTIVDKRMNRNTYIYLHFSKTSLDEPLDVHLYSYFHEQHCVTRRDVIQT